jgi:hypothetical protein
MFFVRESSTFAYDDILPLGVPRAVYRDTWQRCPCMNIVCLRAFIAIVNIGPYYVAAIASVYIIHMNPRSPPCSGVAWRG